MSLAHKERVHLPEWLRQSLENNEPINKPLIHRAEPRQNWSGLHAVQAPGGQETDKVFVRGQNICSGGVGLLSRWELSVGDVFELTLISEDGEAVRVRVAHCTRTIQGYKVGMAFVEANRD